MNKYKNIFNINPILLIEINIRRIISLTTSAIFWRLSIGNCSNFLWSQDSIFHDERTESTRGSMMYCRKWRTNWTNWQPISTQQLANASKGTPLLLHRCDIGEFYEPMRARAARKFAFPDALSPTPPIIADYKVRSNVRHPCDQPSPFQRKIVFFHTIRLFFLSLSLSLFPRIFAAEDRQSPFRKKGIAVTRVNPRVSSEIFNGYRFLMDPPRHVW